MVGRTLSAVTLNESSHALTDNYLKVQLAAPREPNRIVALKIGSTTADRLMEVLEAGTPEAGTQGVFRQV
jgi:hypothetical protein